MFLIFTRKSINNYALFVLMFLVLNSSSYALTKNVENPGKYNAYLINQAPVFGSSSYSYSVSESISLGSFAGSVSATDADGDQLSYSIKSGNTNKALSINAATGTITVIKRLNHHTQSRYSLVVKATDQAGLFSQTSVTIVVQATAPIANFSSITWGTTVSQPYGTHEVHGEVVNEKLYIFGGYDVLKRPNYTPTKRSYVYDPVAKKWTSIADLPHNPKGTNFGGITHEGLTTDGTDVYFAGGYKSNADGTGQSFGTKEVWRYNVVTNTYTALPGLPIDLAGGQLKYLKGKIYYMGGTNKLRHDTSVNYALNLDSLSSGWKVMAPLLNARNHPGSAVFEGKVYFIGGSHNQDPNAIPQKDVDVYDPTTNTWKKVADLPVARDHISSAVVVMGNRILVLGGMAVNEVKSNLISAYSPATDTWENLTPLPVAKAAGVAAVLNGNVHYTGGNFSSVNYMGVPVAKADSLKVESFTLINADTDQPIKTLSNNDTINLATLQTVNFNIRANTLPGVIGSVLFNLTGPQNITATESKVPYALFGDNGNGDYYAWNPPLGKYTLTGTPYSAAGGTETTGSSKTVVFTVINNGAQRQALPQFTRFGGNIFKTTVYPNQIRKTFNVKFDNNFTQSYDLQIADLLGRIYKLGKVKPTPGASNVKVNIEKLALKPGVYFLSIQSNTRQTQIIKLAVEQ